MVMLNPWQEDLVRKSGGLISRAQAATMSPQGTVPTGYNPSAGQNISGQTPEQLMQQFAFGTAPTNARTPEEILRQSGFGSDWATNTSEYERILKEIQADTAKNPDKYKSMPDSEARAESERQSIESLQSQITANVAEQQRKDDLSQKLLDDLNLSAAIANIKPGPAAGKAKAETADYTQPLPEGTGWWDETAAKVTQREAREINETYGPLLKQNGLGPVTSLDEFINLVKSEASKSLETGGGMGLLGTIYTHYFKGRDHWGIFGDPNLTDYTPPTGNNFPMTGPLAGSGYEKMFGPNGELIGYRHPNGDMVDLDGVPIGSDATTLYADPNDPQTMGAGPLIQLLMAAGLFGGLTAGQADREPLIPQMGPFNDWVGEQPWSVPGIQNFLFGETPDEAISTGQPDASGATDTSSLTAEERVEIAKSGAGLYGMPDPNTVERFRQMASRMAASSTAEGLPVFPDLAGLALRNDANWPVSDQYADMQSLYQTLVAGRQQGIATRATELGMINSVIDQAQEEQRLELQAEEAERNYDLARSALQIDAVRAMEEGRQFDQTLAFEEKQAAFDLERVNRQLTLQQQELGLQRYQTDIANPFNVAAMNLLSSSPETRAFSDAQTQSVTQSHLNDALKTAQFHAGSQGLGIGDPEIRKKAAQIAQTISDPRQIAAMLAIAQGIADVTQLPQQQLGAPLGMGGMTSPTGGMAAIPQMFNMPQGVMASTPQVQEGQVPQQPVTAGFNIPEPLRQLGMTVPQGAAFGQPQSIQSFFPSGMPTFAQVANLPTMSQEVLASTGEATGTSRADLMRAAEAITPKTIGSPDSITQSTQRKLMPFRGRS